MKKSFEKIIVLLMIIGLNWAGLSAIGETLAYYNDNESAQENVLSAGSLDFSLNPSNWNPVESEISLELGNTAFRNVGMQDEGSLEFQYTAETDNESGDAGFCDSLDLTAELDGLEVYSGSLTGFLSTATTTLDSWNLTITMPTNYQNSICNFDFLYNGWQLDMPSYGSGGFFDTEKVENTIASWGLRINKVYYDVAGDRGNEGDNEWVEIYNQTNIPLDISGWQICDNASCDTIPSSNAIPSEGFAVITASSTTWGYWDIPDGVVKIVLNSDIGNGLANTDDRVLLKRPDGIEIDAMSYGGDTYAFDPSCPDVVEGNILGRSPNGYDTNQASDFIEFSPPLVNLIYPGQSGTLIWYWYHNYNIQWTAFNPNDNDADLSIDLYYIKDINHDKIISDGDTVHSIVKNTANDGLELWKVPAGFIGYIWIKIVGKGPENPMLNSSMTSGKIFDPFSEELWETNPELILAALAEYEAGAGEPLPEEFLEEPIIETEIPDTPLTDEIFVETTGDEVAPIESVGAEEVPAEPAEEVIPEVVPEEPAVIEEPAIIEETPAEEPVIEETPPAIEENSPVIEQAPAQEEPAPPPPALDPEPTPNPNPDPNL